MKRPTSAIGTKRTFNSRKQTSAFGRKADIEHSLFEVRV
jgi:hypothetical protein